MSGRSAAGSAARAGALTVLPLLVGVVPFGLVAGATAADADLGFGQMLMWSSVVFAGASQLALVDLLQDGAGWVAAALTVWMINLRMLLYSTSLAPHFDHVPLYRRLIAAYALTDQAFAITISDIDAGGVRERRLPFYLGAAYSMSAIWLITSSLGYFIGDAVPDDVPLEFAVPLVFLGLLVLALKNLPALAAAAVSGVVTVVVGEVGLSSVAIIVGALTGIGAGVVVSERIGERSP